MFDYILATAKPLTWSLKFWPVGLASFVIATVATRLCEKIALRLGIVDKPDKLVKTHQKATPYLGGVGMFIGLAAGILCALHCLTQECPPLVHKWLVGIIIAGAVVCVVGCIDDILNIRPWQKVVGQVAAASVLVATGVTPMLNPFDGPTGLIIGTFVVIVFVLGATNSLNLLDGIDGLCAGVTAIMAFGMLLLATLMGVVQGPGSPGPGDSARVVVCLAILGSACGFLLFNYPRRTGARIFMGDAGSLLLGLSMATLMILSAEKAPQFWLASLVIFGLPILDTAVAFARRTVNKKPLFVSDRGHIYDQMMDRGLSIRKTVVLCYGLTAIYAVVGLVVSLLSILPALIVCTITVLISAITVWRRGYIRKSQITNGSTSPSAVSSGPNCSPS